MRTFLLFEFPTQYAFVPSFMVTNSGTNPFFCACAGYMDSKGGVMYLKISVCMPYFI